MRYTSKQDLLSLIDFVEQQVAFVLETTAGVNDYHEFLLSRTGMILFNSTCMCLQSVGEVIRKIDETTRGELLKFYPAVPWRQIVGMRNIISHEYLSVDPELVLSIVREELQPLQDELERIRQAVKQGTHDKLWANENE